MRDAVGWKTRAEEWKPSKNLLFAVIQSCFVREYSVSSRGTVNVNCGGGGRGWFGVGRAILSEGVSEMLERRGGELKCLLMRDSDAGFYRLL